MPRVRRSLAVGFIIAGSAVIMALSPSLLQAFPQNGGSETSTGSAPAGGAELTHTDQLPGNATQGSIAVQPLSGDDLTSFHEMIARSRPGTARRRALPGRHRRGSALPRCRRDEVPTT